MSPQILGNGVKFAMFYTSSFHLIFSQETINTSKEKIKFTKYGIYQNYNDYDKNKILQSRCKHLISLKKHKPNSFDLIISNLLAADHSHHINCIQLNDNEVLCNFN